jgi:glucose/arabinose dehydrogenase/mono/diheme cytochrome c family protein
VRLPSRLSLLAILTLLPAAITPAVEVSPGFVAETLATGLNAATALVPLNDGRILIADQTGPLRVFKNGAVLPTPVLDLSARLDTWWERGLVGVALHPDFPRTPHLFVLYVAKSPYTHHVLSRFTLRGDIADPASEQILLEGDNQGLLTSKQPAGHQGGPLRFGPDGKLYIALGEQSTGQPAQQLDRLQGKILRLNADGSIPADNPFHAQTSGKYRAIWAYGLRNPYGLAFQPETGRLFATDVGQNAFDEVNEIVRGANYGWPAAEGLASNPAYKNPLYAYPPAIGRSVVGAAFHPRLAGSPAGATAFPELWRGKFFFADWKANWIKVLDPDAPQDVTTFARGLDGPVALEFGGDGALYVLNRATIWRDGKAWRPDTGSLVRIRFTGTRSATGPSTELPPTLADTKLFTKLNPLTPMADFVEVKLTAAPWLPGVTARRWLSLPVATRLVVAPDGELEFPAGSVLVQHHVVTRTGAALETQVLRFAGSGPHARMAQAVAYRWTGDPSVATAVRESVIASLPGDEGRRWLFPAAEATLKLDAGAAGFSLPVSLRQLDDAQLRLWAARGWLDPRYAAGPHRRLVALDDARASLDARVRSYLDANCAGCHRPGGVARSQFDARLDTPLERTGLVNAEPVGGDLGVSGARLVVPGAPDKSILVLRLIDGGPFRMPPFGVHHEPAPVVPLLEAWIRTMR